VFRGSLKKWVLQAESENGVILVDRLDQAYSHKVVCK